MKDAPNLLDEIRIAINLDDISKISNLFEKIGKTENSTIKSEV